jgi:hypothetical protein
MDLLFESLGISIVVIGIVHAISSIFIISTLSEKGYSSSLMTPIANLKSLKKLSKEEGEFKWLYYLARVIGYLALTTLLLFVIAIIASLI